jgi:hypothetical protein
MRPGTEYRQYHARAQLHNSIFLGGLNELLLWSPEGSMVIAAQPAAPGIRWPNYASRAEGRMKASTFQCAGTWDRGSAYVVPT